MELGLQKGRGKGWLGSSAAKAASIKDIRDRGTAVRNRGPFRAERGHSCGEVDKGSD